MTQQRNAPDFSAARVLVIGDVMLDQNWSGAANRISPEAPVAVVNINEQHETPGGAGNVAMNIAALGAQVSLLGLVGQDNSAERLKHALQQAGITPLLSFCPLPTICKLRVLARHQQLIRLDFEAADYAQYAMQLNKACLNALNDHDVVVFSDYGKGTLAPVAAWITAAKAAGKTVLVDPKGNNFNKYCGADIVTPNLAELSAAAGDCRTDLTNTARRCLAQTGIKQLLVTQSEQGMCLISPVHDKHWPAQAREVFDVTGAGDTVIATLATALAAGYPLLTAIEFANAAASVVVGKLGTATVSPGELRRALEPQRAYSHGIIGREALAELLSHARRQGQRIVMTNGCFDILHAGHVTYLEEAKALGDRLLVAVNTDASVRRLKGADRPANSLESRMRVLAALAAVDWVVAFDEDTPEALIDAVAPDVLVKGGDNRPENIPGAAGVLARGGEVKVLSYVDGFSTTKTLAKYQ